MLTINRKDTIILFRELSTHPEAAFKRLYIIYYQVLIPVTQHILPAGDLAQLAVQDTLFTLWKMRQKVCSMHNPEGWLHTCARRRALNILRTEKRKRYLEIEEAKNISQQSFHSSQRNELSEEIRSAIQKLPGQQQRIIILQYENGYNRKQIAAICRLSEHTVRNHLYKAYQNLRNHLAGVNG